MSWDTTFKITQLMFMSKYIIVHFGGGGITHIYANMDILSNFGFLGYLNSMDKSVTSLLINVNLIITFSH